MYELRNKQMVACVWITREHFGEFESLCEPMQAEIEGLLNYFRILPNSLGCIHHVI